MDPLIGRTVGGVVIERKLGAGGMASVYGGKDTLDNGVARAIKVLSVASHESYQLRFEREARIGAAIQSPLVVRVHRYGVSGDYRFMVMDVVEGEDMARMLRRTGPLHWGLVASYGRDIANALAAAHSKGIVHRDLKPQNVLVDGESRIKLADFGLAHWRDGPPDLSAGVSLTATGDAFGTPAYMAPEQFRDAKSAGPQADIYALGILIFEALAGRVPFNASTPVDLARLHREVDPPSLEALAGETPERMRDLVARMLSKDPKERPQTALDVARELEDIAARGPTSTVNAPRGASQSKRTDRGEAETRTPSAGNARPSRLKRLLAGGLLLLGLALGAGLATERGRGTVRLYVLCSPEERARFMAIRDAREMRHQGNMRPYLDAMDDYRRDFGETGWMRDAVQRLRTTPRAAGDGLWLFPADAAEMVHVPGGTYEIGVEGGDDQSVVRARTVKVAGFLVDRHEVSNRRYERFLAEWRAAGAEHRCGNPQADHLATLQRSIDGRSPFPECPVTSTTPWDALEYARFYGRRLPSEVEWEVAAAWDPQANRAHLFPWGDTAPSQAQRYFANLAFTENGAAGADGQFMALCMQGGSLELDRSSFGLIDAGGNATEWCAGALPLPGRQPLRGGSILTGTAPAARAAVRAEHDPAKPPPEDAGFRTVMPYEPN